jgi:drug/metabolite transporter (DMT)-like permease
MAPDSTINVASVAAEPPALSRTVAAVRPPRRAFVLLAFFSIYVIWGSTYLVIRFAIETIPPLYTAGFRHLIAGSILLLWCVAKRLKPTWAQIRASFVLGVLFFLIGHGSLHWAELRVPSGLASLLVAVEPIIVFLLSCAVARKWHFNAKLLTGVILGLAGVGLLTARTALSSQPGVLVSTIAILIGATSWSAGIIYSRRSHLSGHPMLSSSLSLLWGAVLLITVATLAGEGRGFSIHAVTIRSWLALGYLIIFGSVIAFSAYNWLLEHYSPTLVATHTFVNPIVAVLLGWLFGGEAITFNVLVAAAMVIGAVVLVDRGTAQLGPAETG